MTACRCRFHLGCTVHDEDGRRWDSYTAEEVAKMDDQEVEPSQPEWSCYCGRHENDEMPEGTPCIWRRTSWEYDEWECECAESYRDTWLSHQSVDWERIGRREDRRWRRQQMFRLWKWRLIDFAMRATRWFSPTDAAPSTPPKVRSP